MYCIYVHTPSTYINLIYVMNVLDVCRYARDICFPDNAVTQRIYLMHMCLHGEILTSAMAIVTALGMPRKKTAVNALCAFTQGGAWADTVAIFISATYAVMFATIN